tara:strand:- start:828 stop:2708 length:1881 start_codon:yes stop_codon:yes gene_type:complete
MKSFRQFIIEAPKDDDPNVDYEVRRNRAQKKKGSPLTKSEEERLRKEVEKQVRIKNKGVGSELSPNTKAGIEAQASRENLGGYADDKPTSVRGGKGNKNSVGYNQDVLDQRRLDAQERTKFKKTTKAERSKRIGKPTHISKKYGVKYTPPTKLPKAEQELIDAGKFRRAKKSTDIGRKPEKISDVKRKIDDLDARNKKYQKREYSTGTKSKNRFGGKSVQDSRGRWVPDPIEDGKPIKDGKSAKRRTSTKTVDQIKKEIEARTTKVKSSTFRKSPDPWNTFSSKKPYRPFGTGLGDTSQFKSTVPNIYGPKTGPKQPKTTEVIKQSEVSQRAKDFTAEVNKKRIKKIHKVSVAGPTTSPTGSSYTPKTPPKIEPVIRSSSGPKFDKSYDKRAPDSSNPLKKKTKTFQDMVSDSQKSISKTKQPKTLVSKLKTVTRRNVTKWLRGTKDWGTGKSSTTKLPFTQTKTGSSTYTPNPGRKFVDGKKIKTSSGNWDGKVYGALAAYSGYQQERDQGSSQTRSVASGITQGAGTAVGTQIFANIARGSLKNAPVHPWIKAGAILGGSIWAAGESQRRSKKLFDYVAGPNQATKNKTANKNKTNTKAIPLLPGNKKKKKQLPNTFLSFSGSK